VSPVGLTVSVDQLITEDYGQHGVITLTNDKKMAKLDGVERV
jgi:hypothetical protein